MGAEAEGRPKPLVEIGGRPILWHIMKVFATYGHSDFILPLGHRGDLFRSYFTEYEALSHDFTFTLGEPALREYHHPNQEHHWRVTLIDAGLATNKGARIRRAAAHATGGRFFATYGDGVGDVDLAALLAFHRAHGKLCTLTGYQPYSQYGVVEAGEDGRVSHLREKPRLASWINAGFFVLERAALEYFQGDDSLDLEKEVLPRLAADGQLMMYRHTGFWASMDTFKEAQELGEIWERGAPWKIWE
jgi:glucose-1-phosphate cytidylyltransferase